MWALREWCVYREAGGQTLQALFTFTHTHTHTCTHTHTHLHTYTHTHLHTYTHTHLHTSTCIFCIIMLEHLSIYTFFKYIFFITFSISTYIMCVCLFSALSRRVGALQISIIIFIIITNRRDPDSVLCASDFFVSFFCLFRMTCPESGVSTAWWFTDL